MCVQNWTYGGNNKEKQNFYKKRVETVSWVGWSILLLPGAGWYIMGFESETLPSYLGLRNCSYSVKWNKYTSSLFIPLDSFTASWSHQSTIRIFPKVLSDSVHSAYTVCQSTVSAMIVCSLFMYTLMGWSPAESITYYTAGYSHSTPTPRFAVIPVIHCADLWCNAVRTLSISAVTTQLSFPKSNTDCATALYISPQARTGATEWIWVSYLINY